MLDAAHTTWRKAKGCQPEPDGPWDRASTCPPLHLARDLVAGAVVGFVTGFFGVGGGFLIVPTLAIALAFTMRTAIGTSLIIITATSLLGLGAHLLAGRTVIVAMAGVLTVACVVGAAAGGALAGRIPQPALGRGFSLLVVVAAVYLLISVAFLGGPPVGASAS